MNCRTLDALCEWSVVWSTGMVDDGHGVGCCCFWERRLVEQSRAWRMPFLNLLAVGAACALAAATAVSRASLIHSC
jgi:hypothetical protein